jgi:3-hydroxyacyl-[acyl-carrier-protein] dehydratase
MKFELLDSIDLLTDTKIIASKSVTMAEDYLEDHFPSFPVLPGVMMIEALVQAASWLLMHRTQFSKSIAVLKEARNVRYGQFVAPGDTLKVEVEFLKDTESGASFKAVGMVFAAGAGSGEQSLSAKLELAYFNLADKNPGVPDPAWFIATDTRLKAHTQKRWTALTASGMKTPRNIPL